MKGKVSTSVNPRAINVPRFMGQTNADNPNVKRVHLHALFRQTGGLFHLKHLFLCCPLTAILKGGGWGGGAAASMPRFYCRVG